MSGTPAVRKIRFIVNPKAGHGIHRTLDAAVDAVLGPGTESDLAVTREPGHASRLAGEAVRLGYDAVVAVGGDGTIRETAEPLKNTAVALGIVPTGSGNGFARHFRIPADPRRALGVIRKGKTRRIDSLLANGRFCLNMAGVGFDAYIAGLFAGQATRGFGTYAKLVIRHYFPYREQQYRIRTDRGDIVRKALLITLANGSQFGNGARIAAGADPADGLMQVVILRKLPAWRIPFAAAGLFYGTLARSGYAEVITTASAEVECDTPMAVHLDGEPAEPVTALEVRVDPATNLVLVP